MTRKEFAKRKDSNHDIVVDAIRSAGHYVEETYRNGMGYPDLHVVTKEKGYSVLVEIKTPGETLTPKEREFEARYPGMLILVDNEQDAVDFLFEIDQLPALTYYRNKEA